MTVEDQIEAHLSGLPEPKQSDLRTLDALARRMAPDARLWFLDGRDERGKTVSNPNIGYGECTLRRAGGEGRPFYRIGLSANTAGVSVYVMGLDDRTHLARVYGAAIGKASVTGYCIRFKALADIDVEILAAAIRYGLERADV